MMHILGFGPLPLLQALLFLSSFPRPVKAHNTACKPIPGDASWPSTSQWQHLNDSLSGRLLQPSPPASACHSPKPSSNESCANLKKSWSTFSFHQDDPISTAWNNMNNDSCLPDTSAPCSGLGYPVYVVNATSASHVKLAVEFARENNVRLNVKASGHDYLKRYVPMRSLIHRKWTTFANLRQLDPQLHFPCPSGRDT